MSSSGEHRRPKVQGATDQTAVLPAVQVDADPGPVPQPASPVRADTAPTSILPPRTTEPIRTNVEDLPKREGRQWVETAGQPTLGVAVGLIRADEVYVHPDTHPTVSGLVEWWMAVAQGDARSAVTKAAAYGSNSLIQVGRKVARLQNVEVDDRTALELGCWDYLVGKVERWTDAVLRGEAVGDDTILDIVTYATMARRVRAVGGWPQ